MDKLQKKKVTGFLAQLVVRIKDDAVAQLSAQLAFFIMLSLFPFLLFLLNLISYTPISASEFLKSISSFIPKDVADVITNAVNRMLIARSATLLSVGALLTLWSASMGIRATMRGLNKAYDCVESRPYWKVRGIAAVFTLGLALVVIITILFLVFGEAIGRYVFSLISAAKAFSSLWYVLRFAVPFVLMVLVFSLLYIIVPNCRIRFKESIGGSIFATAGWITASLVFSVYISNFSNYTSIYGSLGGIIVLLLWLYLSSFVIILGAEINAATAYVNSNKKIDKYENLTLKKVLFKKSSKNGTK